LLSALALEKAGFKAIGTTSWGIARSLGYSDGENISIDMNLAVVKTIVDRVKIPVSADIEAGYGEDAGTIVDNVLRTADLGVAGINIEDTLRNGTGPRLPMRDIEKHADLLAKIRTALDNRGYAGFYVNARVDTYFRLQDPFEETLLRTKAYVESGASGIFVPGIKDEGEIRAVAAQTAAPLNVLALPGVTNCARLQELGVKRLSIGNAFSDKMEAFMDKHAAQLFAAQDAGPLFE